MWLIFAKGIVRNLLQTAPSWLLVELHWSQETGNGGKNNLYRWGCRHFLVGKMILHLASFVENGERNKELLLKCKAYRMEKHVIRQQFCWTSKTVWDLQTSFRGYTTNTINKFAVTVKYLVLPWETRPIHDTCNLPINFRSLPSYKKVCLSYNKQPVRNCRLN